MTACPSTVFESRHWAEKRSPGLQALAERYRCPSEVFESGAARARFPADPAEIIDNLRLERYARRHCWSELSTGARLLRDLYYHARPLLSVNIRKHIQKAYIKGWEKFAFPSWPVDTTVEQISDGAMLNHIKAAGVDRVPFIWFWPEGTFSAVVMTHDVEGKAGYEFCGELMTMDRAFGIKSSFQIVPEGSYRVTDTFVDELRKQGCELNIQDLNHDGRLFSNQQEFRRRASKINHYGRQYDARGFRAAVMYRNLDWYDALDFSYDMSVPTVAHLDPQRGGCCTVMPYFVGDILEVPLTTTQDYMLFHLLGEYSIGLWQAQAERILEKNGLLSFLIHPDYVRGKKAMAVYNDLLCFLRDLSGREHLWFAAPGEVDQWWRDRDNMQILNRNGHWQIEGPGSERAVLAFAIADGDQLKFEIASARC